MKEKREISMKLLVMISIALSLVGCHISRSFQPPPEGYEMYYRHRHNDTQPEVVKRDMLECGFPNVYNNAPLTNNNPNEYVKATLCMEGKGYITNSHGGICNVRVYEKEPACQKHLSQ